MLSEYLERGALAGAIVGLAYGGYLVLVANPLSEYIHEAGHGHGHEHGHGAEQATAVSELTTAVVSAGSGVLWAILLGAVFAVAFYVLEPAMPGGERARAYVLAGAGFLTVSVTPWLVLPPAAPDAEYLYGVQPRQAMYVGLVALGAVVSASAILGYRRTAPRNPTLGLVVGATPVVVLVAVLPAVTPTVVTHPHLSGDLVSAYRGLVVLSQAAIWFGLAASFDWLRRRDASVRESTAGGDDLLASP